MLQYEDEDHDKVVLASDNDLAAAVEHARSAGLKVRLIFLLLLNAYFRRGNIGYCPVELKDSLMWNIIKKV